jgi:acylphosphatase
VKEESLSEEALLRKGFRVVGRVQGVYFRVWTQEVAESLGLRGTVRNRSDGSVETHVEGRPDAVSTFESRLWQGPPASAVEVVEDLESNDALPAGSFTILPTI